jgi:hypothetical protein
MKQKRAMELATGTIVMIVLGLVILVILIIFVQQQVKKSSEKYGKLGEEAEIGGDKCQSIVLGQFCADRCIGEYESFPSPTGKWSDCAKLQGKPLCCRKK